MQNENYLADWLSGKLTDDELRQLVPSADFEAFEKIKSTLCRSVISPPESTDSFAAIKQKMASAKVQPKPKVIPIWMYAAAACLLLSLGWYQVYFRSNETQTDFGSKQVLVLDDDSKVTLNAQTKVCYANLFKYNRTIELQGEAFFEVQKGTSFRVKTQLGEVTVLGTKFNVASFSDYFEVVCHEGKVRVASHAKTIVLTAGESVRFYGAAFENWADDLPKHPLWMNGETALRKVPMQYVFAQFEKQFAVKVVYPRSIENIIFTGSFTNRNKQTALQSICLPLGLKFNENASGTIQISE